MISIFKLDQYEVGLSKYKHQNKYKNKDGMPKQAQLEHIPVLADQVLSLLNPKQGESYLDLTAGLGGHAGLVLGKTKAERLAVLVDRDVYATNVLKAKFGAAEVIHQDYLSASRALNESHRQFDMILADLGVSSVHLNDSSRGFNFEASGPLDMRMDQTQKLSASQVVNHYQLDKLARLLKDFGQEPKARTIANMIVRNRPIVSNQQLAGLVARAWPGRSKVHPATRTFQAIRIEVNQELDQLAKSLSLWAELLKPNGRLAVISFHSLEDKLVKKFMSRVSVGLDSSFQELTRKPVVASKDEIAFNPRARSAKLRAVVKIKIYSTKKVE